MHVHSGTTQVWNGASRRPAFCDVLKRAAQGSERTAPAMRGQTLAESGAAQVSSRAQ